MFGRMADFFFFGLTPLILGMLAVPSMPLASERTISGEVLYRERIALPPNAVLSVELADISLAGAPAAIVGEQVVDPAGQVPIKFSLTFDPTVIRQGVHYLLQARITVDDAIWFINDRRYEIDPLADEPVSMILRMVRQSETPAHPMIFDTVWLAEELGGAGGQPTFSVSADGKVSGKGPCNGYFSTAEVHDGTIAIGEIGSTFMACAPDVMDREKTFFEALRKAARFRVNDGTLVLADSNGKDILRFSAGS